MSDFSLTLVLRLTTSKIINDVAKVQIIIYPHFYFSFICMHFYVSMPKNLRLHASFLQSKDFGLRAKCF